MRTDGSGCLAFKKESAVPGCSHFTPAAPDSPGREPYKRTFYKRTLPTPPCIDFASEDGVFPGKNNLSAVNLVYKSHLEQQT